jgi:N6-adenosine-specific RNA methylase IME4
VTYDVLYLDPPWRYRNVKTGGSHTSGAAQKYPTLSLGEMQALPIRGLTSRDCVCALWATTPLGRDPYDLLESYGFEYKTELYWHKVGRKGTGYWLRGEVEKLLIGTRGTIKAWRHNRANWFEEPTPDDELFSETPPTGLARKPGPHSRKPAAFRDLLMALTPGAHRAELYATERVDGWDSFGLDLDPAHDVRDPAFWAALKAEPTPQEEALHGS